MSDFFMAMHARLEVAAGNDWMQVLDKTFVAVQARLLNDS